MLRNTTLAVLTVLALAASSQAAVMLTTDAGTPTAGLPGFTTYIVTATSDVQGETIAGIDMIGDPANTDPATARGFFGPMNQLTAGPFKTVFGDTNAFLANPEQDSQFLFNTGAPDPAPVNSPAGFNDEGPNYLRALFSRDSGFGQSTPLARLVLPDSAAAEVDYRGVFAVNRAGSIVDLPEISGVLPITDGIVPPVGVNADLGDIANAIINHQFTTSAGDPPISWSNLTLTSSTAPSTAPTLGANGLFTWHTGGSVRPAVYTWNATATNDGGSDTATLTLNLIIPEPATMTMLGLAMIGLVGFGARKRS